jgi:hypothetical protein
MAVSTGGGMEPVWSPDGRRLFYRSGTRLMVADLTTTPGFAVTQRSVLFDSPYAGHPYHQNYDVMPDGRTFVMLQPAGSEGRQIVVVLNWMDEVRRLLASQR